MSRSKDSASHDVLLSRDSPSVTPKSKLKIAYKIPSFSPSKSTSSSLHQHVGHGTTRYVLGHGAWSQATTAPASVQVHYHYLAGRYRDLSYERGLGLLNPAGPSASSSSSAHTLMEIPESTQCHREPLSKNDRKSSTPDGKRKDASDSLRLIAKKTGIDRTSHSSRKLASLFSRDAQHHDDAEGQNSSNNQRTARQGKTSMAAPHGAKYGSLRSYAEERIKAQEMFESRIQRVTDVGRLKWEAKAAMLNNAYPLAILLYTRAAQLGSISASLALAKIYCTGITKGNKPVVVLNHRDPLLSLGWTLEASAMLQHRLAMREKRRDRVGNSREKHDDKSQHKQIIALLARLLRCRQLHMTRLEDVILPQVKPATGKDGKEARRSAWHAVCESTAWLEAQLLPQDHLRVRNEDESIGPDDEEGDMGGLYDDRIQIVLIQALVATRRWAIMSDHDDNFKTMQTCWANFAASLQEQKHRISREFGNMQGLARWCDDLRKDDAECARRTLDSFVDILDDSLIEARIPAAPPSALGSLHDNTLSLQSPRKRRADEEARNKTTLVSLEPINTEAQSVDSHHRPALLRKASSSMKIPSLAIDEAHAAGKPRYLLQRAASFSGLDRLQLGGDDTTTRFVTEKGLQSARRGHSTQMTRRPSSIMSDSPSLLFHDEPDDQSVLRVEDNARSFDQVAPSRLPSASSVTSNLWKAAPLHARKTHNANLRKERVVSLYSDAIVGTSDPIYTGGTNTFDYDIDASLHRQQARRRRGDSNASISTVASITSTTPSISGSMAGGPYAHGHFLTPSISSDINGFDLRLNGAAESLRRIRRTNGIRDEASSRHGSTEPRLNETLEQLIADSTSYRAVQNQNIPTLIKQHASSRSRKASITSLRSLTAFTASNHRQSALGGLASPSLQQGASNGRAFSVFNMPTLSNSTSFFSPSSSVSALRSDSTPLYSNANGVESKGNKASASALGSLRLLSKQSKSRNHIPKTAASTLLDNGERKDLTPSTSQCKDRPVDAKTESSKRAFDAFDPTMRQHCSTSSPSSASNSLHDDHSKQSSHPKSNPHSSNLDPALAEAEDKSGLKTTSTCLICSQKVVNAPISKSGEVFCSRNCRIERKQQRISSQLNEKGRGKDKVVEEPVKVASHIDPTLA